jgi:ferric-dicitrate binding protein FerR (iron transport regulator)
MKDDMDWQLILRYLEGHYSAEDEKNLNEWLQTDIENRQTFDLTKKIWDTPEARLPGPDVEKAWVKVKESAGIEAPTGGKVLPFKPHKKRVGIQRMFVPGLLKVAAVLLFMISASYLFYKLAQPTSMHEIFVESTMQEKVRLPDGSEVILDAGSIFRYPERFDSHTREVFLNGEGYFEVAPAQEKPFMVHANNAVITVLGTKFNVRAWRQNKSIVVAVAEGRVSLRPETVKQPDAGVIIAKNEMSEMMENECPSPPQYTDINTHLLWMRREVHFRSTPLQEVLDQLERWYDLEISLSDESYTSNRVTIFIEDKPIAEILDLIALMNDFRYEQQGKKITFSPKE